MAFGGLSPARKKVSEMTKMLSTRLFEANWAAGLVEEEVCDFLNEVLGDGTWEDFTSDWYDRSIEIFGVKYGLTPEQQERLWSQGFHRCWTHTLPTREGSGPETGERSYAAQQPKNEPKGEE